MAMAPHLTPEKSAMGPNLLFKKMAMLTKHIVYNLNQNYIDIRIGSIANFVGDG